MNDKEKLDKIQKHLKDLIKVVNRKLALNKDKTTLTDDDFFNYYYHSGYLVACKHILTQFWPDESQNETKQAKNSRKD